VAAALEPLRLALGTVELGLDYGFRDGAHYARPTRADAVALVRHVERGGAQWLDTAPAYGGAEEILGEAGTGVPIATKVTVPAAAQSIRRSIDESRRRLRRDCLDLVQLHNATPEIVRDAAVLEILSEAIAKGHVAQVGASVYGEEAALAVLEQPLFRTLQVAFNLLDQTMAGRVFPQAQERRVAILVRSAFLRGVLTPQVHALPAALAPLRDRVLAGLRGTPVEHLPEIALRFCLSFPAVSAVIAGVKTIAEWDANARAARQGALSNEDLAHWRALAMNGDPLVSPANWQGLI